MTAPVLDNLTARTLFLHRHGLGTPRAPEGRGAALTGLIERLGFVQVDSVNTLARAHDMILFSRAHDYRPASLRWLNDRARTVFEHWTHDASVIPVAFFPYWKMKFARDHARLATRWKDWHGSAFHDEIESVLDRIAERGACCSRDVAGARAEKSTGWWDWHPSKTALEYLWRSGRIAVTKREGFQKHYDLTERVIPEEARAHEPSETETIDWACSAALDRLGFATSGELAAFWDLVTPEEAKAWTARALADGRIVPAETELADGTRRAVFVAPGTLEALPDLPPVAPRLRILSPFDPALRDRKRAERLFGYHFRIEIFVPEAQRRYGYYVFPVIEGANLIGRIDVAADRDAGVLRVAAFWPEHGVAMGRGREARLGAELDRLARFGGCDRVEFAEGWLRAP
ncbi:winged helix-turn-helix domain-containing protein [Rhodobacterales bacterium HKCCE3408]|nr:winged helix-turn-helix domain-containing protein [Rhodobacterales bacterium HKCCE3408]